AFAARVVASTGAHLHATVCTGLSALSGPRHGGATARAHALIGEALAAPSPGAHVAARWERGADLPGFGHALYPDGDPRAAALLEMLRDARGRSPAMRGLEQVITAAEEASGQRPNIDLLLAALCHTHGLPAAPALVMFAAGRLAGWLAHALEQQASGMLIRPRARYVGEDAATTGPDASRPAAVDCTRSAANARGPARTDNQLSPGPLPSAQALPAAHPGLREGRRYVIPPDAAACQHPACTCRLCRHTHAGSAGAAHAGSCHRHGRAGTTGLAGGPGSAVRRAPAGRRARNAHLPTRTLVAGGNLAS